MGEASTRSETCRRLSQIISAFYFQPQTGKSKRTCLFSAPSESEGDGTQKDVSTRLDSTRLALRVQTPFSRSVSLCSRLFALIDCETRPGLPSSSSSLHFLAGPSPNGWPPPIRPSPEVEARWWGQHEEVVPRCHRSRNSCFSSSMLGWPTTWTTMYTCFSLDLFNAKCVKFLLEC